MWGGGQGGDKDGGSGTGSEDNVQGNFVFIVVVWEQELGGDRGHAKITRGLPSLVSQTYCRDDGVAYEDQRVGVDPGV